MERHGWATINEVSDNGFYAYQSGEHYTIAKENMGKIKYEDFAGLLKTNHKYIKRIMMTDFCAIDADNITFNSKSEAEAARDWFEAMYICKKATAM